MKCGLLPLCKESIVIGEVSQHSYLGSMSEPEEKEKLGRDLGPINKVTYLVLGKLQSLKILGWQ